MFGFFQGWIIFTKFANANTYAYAYTFAYAYTYAYAYACICLWLFSGENILHKKEIFFSQKYLIFLHNFFIYFHKIFSFFFTKFCLFFQNIFHFVKCHRPLTHEYLPIYVFLRIAQLPQKLNNWGHFYSSYFLIAQLTMIFNPLTLFILRNESTETLDDD